MIRKLLSSNLFRLSSLLASLLLLGQFVYAQTSTVSGVIKDAAGQAIPGASILIKGTTTGTVTNNEGLYRIDVPQNAVLVVSFIGYGAQEVAVGNQSGIDIVLEEDASTLNEVVVIGYGEVKKKDITGAVASVNTAEMLQASPTNISQGLQGRVAGVYVSKNDGAPGAGVSLQIRGPNTFLGSAEPLYVIDGIPFVTGGSAAQVGGDNQTSNPLSFINPQDIESIEILKDASATAIYGARAANGVVLITTKKGSKDRDNLEFVVNYGVSRVSKKIDVLNGYQYAQFQNEAVTNRSIYEGTALGELPFPGTSKVDSETGETIYSPAPEDFLNGYNNGGTNWQDQIFETATTADYTLALNGGNDKGNYSISGNVLDQTGVIVNSSFKRYSIRGNVFRNVRDWISIGSNTSITRSENNFVRTNSDGGTGSSLTGAVRSAIVYPSTYPIIDPSTLSSDELARMNTEIGWYASSPYYYVRHAKNTLTTTQLFSSSFVEVSFLENFKLRQNIGFNYTYNVRDIYYDRFTQEGKAPVNGLAYLTDNTWLGRTLETILSYNKTFQENHNVNAVVAFTNEQYDSRNSSIQAQNFPNDILGNNDLYTAKDRPVVTNGKAQRRNLGFLGRVNYGYKDKYLATASFRRDGTSVFPKNKWGTFYAVALAWRASDEAFIQNLDIFDDLKLRVGYGQTGNQAIGSYDGMSRFEPANAAINGSLQNGFAEPDAAGPANSNLKWETTEQWNIGIDIRFLSNRIGLTIDAYQKMTHDLLQRLTIPRSTGFGSQLVNFGNIQNRGLEITTTADILTGESALKWNVNANISFNRNKIKGLPADQFATRLFNGVDNVFLQRNGQPVGVIYGYVEDGMYDNLAEVVADPVYANQSNAIKAEKVGEIKYKNLDNNPLSIGSTDRTIIGNVNPDYIFGIINNFDYKNFTFSFFVQGVMGNDILNANLTDYWKGDQANVPSYIYDSRWTPDNTAGAEWPKALRSARRNYLFSDRYIEDGSYIRLKSVSLGYTFKNPVKLIQSVNVYTNVSNLLTITGYKWYDPDVNAFAGDAGRRGVDMNSYPNSITYTVGLKAMF
jgi:TonB-linked SusC/RagA family outer membrane protein